MFGRAHTLGTGPLGEERGDADAGHHRSDEHGSGALWGERQSRDHRAPGRWQTRSSFARIRWTISTIYHPPELGSGPRPASVPGKPSQGAAVEKGVPRTRQPRVASASRRTKTGRSATPVLRGELGGAEMANSGGLHRERGIRGQATWRLASAAGAMALACGLWVARGEGPVGASAEVERRVALNADAGSLAP